jgi:hypothetical protein
MATTTNYGWSTPDDCALVKDGASAIRTLGSSIDTSVKSLSPGTTAGDIDYYTSSTAKSRLAIGSTGQVLTVAGGVPSWATTSAGGMTLISTTTLTGASVTLSSIPQTYVNLLLYIKDPKPATDGAEGRFTLNGTATGYSMQQAPVSGSGAVTFGSSFFRMFDTLDNTSANGFGYALIPDYTNGSWKTAQINGFGNDATTTTSYRYAWYQGFTNITAAVTSLVISPSSGNWTSGTALLYGVK